MQSATAYNALPMLGYIYRAEAGVYVRKMLVEFEILLVDCASNWLKNITTRT